MANETAEIANLTRMQRRYGVKHDSVLMHCPGPFRQAGGPLQSEWADACALALSDEALRGSYSGMDGVTLVTYSNYEDPTLLERGLEFLGCHDFALLKTAAKPWSHRYKLTLLLEWLQSGQCKSEYLLCLDADDNLFVNSPSLVIPRFQGARCEILFGATMADAPPCRECWNFECSVAEYKDPLHAHLNAGGFIGRTAFIVQCAEEILEGWRVDPAFCETPKHFSDQLGWRRMHRRYYPRIKIDWQCAVFLRFDGDR